MTPYQSYVEAMRKINWKPLPFKVWQRNGGEKLWW